MKEGPITDEKKEINEEENKEKQKQNKKMKKKIKKMRREKLKVVITRVRKECDRLNDINMSAVEALEQETKKARKEEWSRNKFRGALS